LEKWGGGGLKKRSKEKRTDIQWTRIIKIRERERGEGGPKGLLHMSGAKFVLFSSGVKVIAGENIC
jgi:hypothetical protein